MSKSIVSVIIPSYNMAGKIERALESVLSQSYSSLEVIVVDDGSQDDTREKLKQFEKVVYCHQHNRGRASALNRGINLAKGDYIAMLDADDTLPADSVLRRVTFLEQGFDAVFGDTNYIDASGDLYHVRKPGFFRNPEELAWQFLGGLQSPFCAATVLYRKEPFLRCGLFDETLRRSEDIDLMMRLLKNCFVSYLPHAVYDYHVDTHSLWQRLRHRKISFQERLRIIDKHFEGTERVELFLRTAAVECLKMGYEMVSQRR